MALSLKASGSPRPPPASSWAPSVPLSHLQMQDAWGGTGISCQLVGGGSGLDAVRVELLPLEMATDASWWRLRWLIQGFVV